VVKGPGLLPGPLLFGPRGYYVDRNEEVRMKSSKPIHERIMERVCKMPMSDGGCWIWTGADNGKGYGVIKDGDKRRYVHRVMADHYGMYPEGLTVDHLCGTRSCVRRSHLTLCDAAENARRQQPSAVWRAVAAEFITYQMKQYEEEA
jgi:hypothetical protein